MAQIIRSYPQMMIHKDTSPPFIHPMCHDPYTMRKDVPKSITNCTTLMDLFFGGTIESKTYTWRAIRMEQERLFNQYLKLPNSELLASVQALMIYAILSFSYGGTDDGEREMTLLHTVRTVSSHLSTVIGSGELSGAMPHEHQSWQQWRVEFDRTSEARELFALKDDGRLVRLKQRPGDLKRLRSPGKSGMPRPMVLAYW
jgi:hypothetical protein